MKIKFISDAVITVEGKPQTLFEQNDVQDLNPNSAQRWIRRGVAVEYTEPKVSKKRAAKSASSSNG